MTLLEFIEVALSASARLRPKNIRLAVERLHHANRLAIPNNFDAKVAGNCPGTGLEGPAENLGDVVAITVLIGTLTVRGACEPRDGHTSLSVPSLAMRPKGSMVIV